MGAFLDYSGNNRTAVILLVVGILGGGFYGLQKGVNCTLKEISVEKPGNETVLLENTGMMGLTLEIKKKSYKGAFLTFAAQDEEYVTIEKGGEARIELEDGKIMQYKFKSCEAESGLVRYGEIERYDGGVNPSKAKEKLE